MPKVISLKASQREPRLCPNCGHDQDAPLLTPRQIVTTLGLWQRSHPPLWHWAEEELVALERALETGDHLIKLFAQSVTIRRKSGLEIVWERGRGTNKETESKTEVS